MADGLAVALVLMAGLLLDHLVPHQGAGLLLARKGLAPVEWLAFRRRPWNAPNPGLG